MRKRKHDQRVDAIFVNPPSPDSYIYIRDINRHGRSSWERMIWPQTNLAYLAAVAERVGLSVDVIDCIGENISWPEYTKILSSCMPRYCFSNVISATYRNDLEALRLAKHTSGAITFGMGPHITDRPAETLKDSEGLDFAICHEAEETLDELLRLLERNHGFPAVSELEGVSGIAFIPGHIQSGLGQEAVITRQRPFIQDLDLLPWPRHDLLPLDQYWAPFLGHYTFVEASRGCYYRCIFCRQAVMWQWKYRRRSARSLVNEAQYVHSLGVKNILFHADTFTLDPEFVEDVCEEMMRAGTRFRWACNTHVRSILDKAALVEKMKRAGCWMIAIGIESGDDQVLQNIKKQITVHEAESVVRMIHKAGIEAWGYFVLGLPGDSVASMEKTIRFALSLPLKIAKFDIAAPYPGTEFYNFAQERGYLQVTCNEDFDQNASAVVEYPNLPRAEIKKAVRRATRRFYFRVPMILRLVRELAKPTTLRTVICIVRDQFRLLSDKKRASAHASFQRRAG